MCGASLTNPTWILYCLRPRPSPSPCPLGVYTSDLTYLRSRTWARVEAGLRMGAGSGGGVSGHARRMRTMLRGSTRLPRRKISKPLGCVRYRIAAYLRQARVMHEERQGAAIRMGSATSTLRLGAAGATVLIAGLGPSGWMSAGLRVSVLTQRVSPAVVLLSSRLAAIVHACALQPDDGAGGVGVIDGASLRVA